VRKERRGVKREWVREWVIEMEGLVNTPGGGGNLGVV
jgi:hypothetical protein